MNIDWKTLTFNMSGAQLNSITTLPSRLWAVIKEPSSNWPAFILILAILVVFIVVVVLTIVSFVSRRKKTVLVETYTIETGLVDDQGNPETQTVEREIEMPKDRMKKYYAFISFVVIVAIMWIVTGVTTQLDFVCGTCHNNTAHVKEISGDPHEKTRCVQCHEPGGTIGSVTTSVPSRLAHIVVGTFKTKGVPGYKTFSSSSCEHCHKSVATEGVVTDNTTGIRMSHEEPYAAGEPCTNCHVLDTNGKVSSSTNGMQPCLRCHNGTTAGADCGTCHVRGTKYAAEKPSPDNAQALVNINPNQLCYNCHNPGPCDSCHGVRMPHVAGYTNGGPQHVADAKKYGVNTCYKCHEPGEAAAQRGVGSEGMASPCWSCHTVNADGTIG